MSLQYITFFFLVSAFLNQLLTTVVLLGQNLEIEILFLEKKKCVAFPHMVNHLTTVKLSRAILMRIYNLNNTIHKYIVNVNINFFNYFF